MPVLSLDHFTLRTARLKETVEFFKKVIRLEVGWRPPFRFPGEWMYAGGKPLLHIVALSQDDMELIAYLGEKALHRGGGCVDHVALRCNDLAEMQAHLKSCNQHFRERIVPEGLEHQLFVEEPNGFTVELIFPYSTENKIAGTEMPRLPTASEKPPKTF